MSNKKQTNGIYWFRKCLRLHDNPALMKAISECELVYPIFILDSEQKLKGNAGPNIWRFLWESLNDLDRSLSKLNSRLIVIESVPNDAFTQLVDDWGITDVYYEGDTEPYSRERDDKVNKILESRNVNTHVIYSHTLYDPNHLYRLAGNRCVLTYSSFLSLLNKVEKPSKPIEAIDKKFASLSIDPNKFKIPDLTDLCPQCEDLDPSIYLGGETEGLKRLENKMKDAEWVCSFSKPNSDPFSLQPSTTVLSPYLRFGCISCRLLFHKIKEAYKSRNHTTPPESLEGQLLWREFFYFVGAFTKNFDKVKGNQICRQIEWDENDKYFEAWATSTTGYPLVDAVMTQLRKEGWIHHLARHIVACFLTRGDLYCSWERGLKVFEELLLDADWSINAANWQWLSASTFFNQYWRVYSPIAFGKKYKESVSYIKKYLPILKNYPDRFIFEPWKAPIEIQRKSKTIIGQDYPYPIVDHSKVSATNKERIKKHFHE